MTRSSHGLGEVLRTAREEKGLDLDRAERDTKIRARYLAALERGEYEDLPGAVYTKGFLRNYGNYLGLDPDYLIGLYRLEAAPTNGDRPVAVTPSVLARPPRAFVVTPTAMLAVALTLLVALFGGYLVYQLVTFARVPELVITDPPRDLAEYAGTEYTVRGRTEPNSSIAVDGLAENPGTVADSEGNFELTVRLVPGVNVITIVASDPRTNRDSEPAERRIYVGTGSAETDAPEPALAVDAPAEGARVDGPVAIAVTATADGATAAATPIAPAAPNFTISDLSGRAVQFAATLPPAPEPLELTAGGEGGFEGSYTLPPGEWELTIEASSAGGGSLTATRRVTVTPAAGLSVRLEVRGGPSWFELYEDGVVEQQYSFRDAPAGANIDLSARRTIRVRAGSAGAVSVVVNGIRVGAMGAVGEIVDWTITSSP